MLCPKCSGSVCRRSRRKGLADRAMSLLGFLPWRCGACQTRFYARAVAIRYLYLVHCGTCGNLEVERVSRDRVVGGVWASLQRMLRMPAYRCDACRTRFFSLRRFAPVASSSFVEFNQPAVPALAHGDPGNADDSSNSPAEPAEAAQLDDSGERKL